VDTAHVAGFKRTTAEGGAIFIKAFCR